MDHHHDVLLHLRPASLFALCLIVGAGGQDENSRAGGRYGVFMFPPPFMCFPNNSAVYVATALSDGLFTDPHVKRDGIRLRLRINGVDMASVDWHSASSGEEADEGLAHHFSIPGLPDGDYEAELMILAAGHDESQVGRAAQTSFQVDQTGRCEDGSSEETANSDAHHAGRDVRNQQRVLVSVAVGKKAWMSSVAPGSHAKSACDGSTMVSSIIERNALSPNSSLASDVWWEVDLGHVHDVHLIDVWAGLNDCALLSPFLSLLYLLQLQSIHARTPLHLYVCFVWHARMHAHTHTRAHKVRAAYAELAIGSLETAPLVHHHQKQHALKP